MPPPENCVGDPGKDCNGNCVPDELEEDCNENMIPDDCDIDSGFSDDVNGNRIPDECEDITFADQFAVTFGELRSGTLAEVAESDDQYLIIEQRPAFSPLLPLIRVDMIGTSPFNPASEFGYTLEAAATALPPNVPQRIEFFDFRDTNGFVLVDDRTATTNDSVVQVLITSELGGPDGPGGVERAAVGAGVRGQGSGVKVGADGLFLYQSCSSAPRL
jgi:hypothetical protein